MPVIVGVNKDGSVVTNNASMIQKFTIMPQVLARVHVCMLPPSIPHSFDLQDFSGETGELTATQKLKRGHVHNQHEKFIDSMYAESAKGTYVDFDDANSALVKPGATSGDA